MTPEQIELLKEAFFNECSEEEAAFHAGITMSELNEFAAQHTDDGEWLRMKNLYHSRNAQASVNLGKSVRGGSIEDSKWVLERRRAKMYSPKAELNVTTERPMIILPPALPSPDTKTISEFNRIIDVDASPADRDVRPA